MRWLSGLIFFTVLTTVLGAVHYYLWKRLVVGLHLPRRLHLALSIWLWGSFALVLLSFPLVRLLPVLWQETPLIAAAFTWLGIMFLLLVVLLVRDGALWLSNTIRYRDDPQPDAGRRLFFTRLSATGVWALTAGLTVLSVREALKALHVKDVSVPLADLPPDLEGFTIVQVTDVHVGPTIGREFVEAMVAQINTLDADVVAITGDLVDGSVEHLRDAVAPLGTIRSRFGTYFVPGNHEYYSGLEEWLAHLPTLGVQVLMNRWVNVGEGTRTIDIAGVDDETGEPDMAKAVAGRSGDRPLVVLAHQPRTIKKVDGHGARLQLSGHTHAGQIWPFTYLVFLAQPYVGGLYKHKDMHIYVSPGTGYWGPPMRLGTQAEVTRIVLTKG